MLLEATHRGPDPTHMSSGKNYMNPVATHMILVATHMIPDPRVRPRTDMNPAGKYMNPPWSSLRGSCSRVGVARR
jgi:hypothetical protein